MRKSLKSPSRAWLERLPHILMGVDDPAWLATAGKALMAISVFFLGKNARDRDVISEMENDTG